MGGEPPGVVPGRKYHHRAACIVVTGGQRPSANVVALGADGQAFRYAQWKAITLAEAMIQELVHALVGNY